MEIDIWLNGHGAICQIAQGCILPWQVLTWEQEGPPPQGHHMSRPLPEPALHRIAAATLEVPAPLFYPQASCVGAARFMHSDRAPGNQSKTNT